MQLIHTQQDAIRLLRSHGVYPTAQRVHMAQKLFAGPQHLCADQIQELVNQGDAKISKATVYNTLALFMRKGLIREILANPSKAFYDTNVSDHHHMYNVDTGELSDIDLGSIPLPPLTALPENVIPERVNIVVQVRNNAE